MLKDKEENSSSDNLFRNIGELVVLAGLTCSIFVLVFAAACPKDKKADYHTRLRQSYDGLSPEDY
jgi:hypothetical protein